jgi:hypothetical protein
MSSFADIFISCNHRPHIKRTGSSDWLQIRDLPIFVSISEKWEIFDCPIFYHKKVGNKDFFVLGELYSYKDSFLKNGADSIRNKLVLDIAENNLDIQALNGHFLLVIYDCLIKNTDVIVNRLGTYHAYIGQSSSGDIISTYLFAITPFISKEYDWKGISTFLNLGFFFGNTTYYSNVKVLEPSIHYKFGPKLIVQDKYKYWEWKQKINHSRSFKETLNEFAEILNSITEDLCTNSRVAIPISGGLDSRTMAATSSKINSARIWSYSYGYTKESIETKIAERIARKRNLSFSKFTISNYLFEKLNLIKESTELFHAVDVCRQASIVEELEKNSDFVIAAHWGDVWMDDMGLLNSKFACPNFLTEFTFKKIAKRGRKWLVDNFLKMKTPAVNVEKLIKEEFSDYYKFSKNILEDDFKIKAFKTDLWSFRWTLASIRMYQQGAFPRLPFYDNRIVDFFQTITSETVSNRKLQIEYLKVFHPDLAKIKWQAKGVDLFLYKYFNNKNIFYRIINKIYRLNKAKKPIQRAWEVFFIGNENREKLENIILSNSKLLEITGKEGLEKFFDEFYEKPDASNGYTMQMLLTLALILE